MAEFFNSHATGSTREEVLRKLDEKAIEFYADTDGLVKHYGDISIDYDSDSKVYEATGTYQFIAPDHRPKIVYGADTFKDSANQ